MDKFGITLKAWGWVGSRNRQMFKKRRPYFQMKLLRKYSGPEFEFQLSLSVASNRKQLKLLDVLRFIIEIQGHGRVPKGKSATSAWKGLKQFL